MQAEANKNHLPFLVKISFLGGLTILTSLEFYQLLLSSNPVEIRNIELLDDTAVIVLTMLLLGLCLPIIEATRHLIQISLKSITNTPSLTVILLSQALNDKRSFRAFVAASVLYGIFFGFTSGFLVYLPQGSISESYGVSVPSTLTVICCGTLGQIPQFLVYLTQEFAILIVPINLILLLTVSWLVGLNVAVATYSHKNRSISLRNHWFGGLGAIVGVFAACPTCAGFFFLTMLGFAGALTFALAFSYLQIVLACVGLPLLLVTPSLAVRKMPKDWTTSCQPSGNKWTN